MSYPFDKNLFENDTAKDRVFRVVGGPRCSTSPLEIALLINAVPRQRPSDSCRSPTRPNGR